MMVLRLLGWTSRCFSVIEGNSTNTCIHAFSGFLLAESPWTSIKQRQTTTTHNTNRHCRVRFYTFVRQPLSKQLYVLTCYSIVHLSPYLFMQASPGCLCTFFSFVHLFAYFLIYLHAYLLILRLHLFRERQTYIRETKLHRKFSRRQNDRTGNVHLRQRNAATWRVHRSRGGTWGLRATKGKKRQRKRKQKPNEASENQVDKSKRRHTAGYSCKERDSYKLTDRIPISIPGFLSFAKEGEEPGSRLIKFGLQFTLETNFFFFFFFVKRVLNGAGYFFFTAITRKERLFFPNFGM